MRSLFVIFSALALPLVCPDECYQCCAPKRWTQLVTSVRIDRVARFKCILKDPSRLPASRTCDAPETRPWSTSGQQQTECDSHARSAARQAEDVDHLKGCTLLSPVARYLTYAWGKRGEAGDAMVMTADDKKVADAIASIFLKRSGQRSVMLPLTSLSTLHPIDREPAILKSASRARAIRAVIDSGLLEPESGEYELTSKQIEGVPLLEPFQSISGFEVVKMGPKDTEEYVAFDGNGRLYGLKWGLTDAEMAHFTVQCAESIIPESEQEYIWEKVRQARSGHLPKLTYQPEHLQEDALKQELAAAGGATAAVDLYSRTSGGTSVEPLLEDERRYKRAAALPQRVADTSEEAVAGPTGGLRAPRRVRGPPLAS